MRPVFHLLGLLAVMGLPVACNTAAKINAPKIYFDDAQILGAVPVIKVGDAYQRVCTLAGLEAGQALDGLAIDLELVSTERKEGDQSNIDRDRSIQVGDYINRHYVEALDLSPDNLKVSVDCAKRTPADSIMNHKDCDPGADVMSPSAEVKRVTHVAFTDRGTAFGGGDGSGIGLVVLLDQSGSVGGFVNPDPDAGPVGREMPYDDANIAIYEWQQAHNPQILDELASDKLNYRISTLRQLISDLNSTDKLLIMSYSEDAKNKLVCQIPGVQNPQPQDCFTARRDFLKKSSADTSFTVLDDEAPQYGGRTPLWESLYGAIEFLGAQQGLAAKHILVLNDGPDTCYPGSETFAGGSACADKGFEDVVSLVSNTVKDVHVSFAQYQAKGYPARDVRQAELACLTDGHHVFVNRLDMVNDNLQFEYALDKAVDRIRYAFLGQWRLFVESDTVTLDLPWPQGTPVGGLYNLVGTLKFLANATFITEERLLNFAVGKASTKTTVQATPSWDNTLLFRKDCSANSQCGGSDENACKAYCGWESRLCAPAALNTPTGTVCDNGGNPGVCCQITGVCQSPQDPCQ
jgi:hypothetical protein